MSLHEQHCDHPSFRAGGESAGRLRQLAAELGHDVEITESRGRYRLEYGPGEVCEDLGYVEACEDLRAMAGIGR